MDVFRCIGVKKKRPILEFAETRRINPSGGLAMLDDATKYSKKGKIQYKYTAQHTQYLG